MALDYGEEIERLHRRSSKAWEDASLHHSTLREVYKWYLPEDYYEMQDSPSSSGAYNQVYDQTGMQALEDGASQIAEAMFPWDQVWARWAPRPDVPDDDTEAVDEIAKDITKKCTALITSSNFDAAMPLALKEFLIGTAFLSIDVDPSDDARLRFTAFPAWQWAIEADTSGRVQAMFRKLKIRARDLETTLEDAEWSEAAMNLAKDSPDTMVDVCMATYWLPKEKSWACCYYEETTKHKAYEHPLQKTPFVIVTRASPSAGRAWGSGPAKRALPDVKVANRVVELTLKNAAMAVTGMWQVEDDGVVNPSNIRITPGAIIPISTGSKGLQPLEFPGHFDVSQLLLEELRVNIRRSFYVMRISEQPDMSATEYQGRVQQQLREQRGVYGQLKGFVEQIMLCVLELARLMGKVRPEEYEKLAQVELTGPLAADIRGLEVESVKQVARDIAEVCGPEVSVASVTLGELVPWLAQKRYVESKLFKDKAGMQKLQDQIQQTIVTMMAQAATDGQMAQAPQ